MKNPLFILVAFLFFCSSCSKEYVCDCESKTNPLLVSESLGETIKAPNTDKALTKCKNNDALYQANPDDTECKVLELK